MSNEINFTKVISNKLPHLEGLLNDSSNVTHNIRKVLLYKTKILEIIEKNRKLYGSELHDSLTNLSFSELLESIHDIGIELLIDNSVKVEKNDIYSQMKKLIDNNNTLIYSNTLANNLMRAEYRGFRIKGDLETYSNLEKHLLSKYKKELEKIIIRSSFKFINELIKKTKNNIDFWINNINSSLLYDGTINNNIINKLGKEKRYRFLGATLFSADTIDREYVVKKNIIPKNLLDIFFPEKNPKLLTKEIKDKFSWTRFESYLTKTGFNGTIGKNTIKKIGKRNWSYFTKKLADNVSEKGGRGLLVDFSLLLISILQNLSDSSRTSVIVTQDTDFSILGRFFIYDISKKINNLNLPNNTINILYTERKGGFKGFSL